jgi:hypothetical protein
VVSKDIYNNPYSALFMSDNMSREIKLACVVDSLISYKESILAKEFDVNSPALVQLFKDAEEAYK